MKRVSGTPAACTHMPGFSLAELMIALVISLILCGGMLQIFLGSKKSFTIQDTLGRLQENGRYAIDTLTTDLRRAGYWGGNTRIRDARGSLDLVADTGSCPNDTSWGRMLDRRITGLNDTSTGYDCIPTSGTAGKYLRGDVLTIRYAVPRFGDAITTPAFEANRLYLRADLLRARIFRGRDAAAAVNSISTPWTGFERQSELLARAYYIGDSGRRCGNGDVVPSLYRQVLGASGKPVTREVVQGVDHFQVRYGVDSDGDLAVDRYLDAGDAGLDSTAEWRQVIAARMWVLTRAECAETGLNPAGSAYAMGDIRYTPADRAGFGYRRQLYQGSVWLRNRIPAGG